MQNRFLNLDGVANGRVEERLKDAVAQLKPDIVIIAGELKD